MNIHTITELTEPWLDSTTIAHIRYVQMFGGVRQAVYIYVRSYQDD